MQGIDCENHQLKKDFVFCLEPGCNDRLVCKKCYVLDRKHDRHKFIMIEYLMENDENELKRIFDSEYLKNIEENMTAEQFIQKFDNEFNKYLDEKEEELRTSFEKMIANYRASLEKTKQNIYDSFNVKEIKNIQQIKQNVKDLIENDNSQQKQRAVKEQIDCCNKIGQIKGKLDQMMKQIEQTSQKALNDVQKLFETCERIRYLKYYTNIVEISDPSKMNEYRNNIRQMQEQGNEYQIYMNFYSNTDLYFKQQVIDMVDQLGANHKVGKVRFDLYDNNKFNVELLVKMVSKYNNIWFINIQSYCSQIDNDIHNQLKTMVANSMVLHFNLDFIQICIEIMKGQDY